MIKSIIYILIIVQLSQCVDRSNFKTCDQSAFCKRHRNVEANKAFSVIPDSIKVDKSSLSMNLLKSDESTSLINLQLVTLESNTLRVRFTEVSPLINRYEPPVGDALVSEPIRVTISDIEKSDKSSTFNFGENTIEITYSPLQIDIYEKESKIPLMSLNSKALLKFEHTRTKVDTSHNEEKHEEVHVEEEEKHADQQGEGEGQGDDDTNREEDKEHVNEDVPVNNVDNEEGLWQESFKSHEDTKPHGPQSIGLDFVFPAFEHAYGIPEHADTFKLKSTKSTDPYRLYNLDVFEYELYNPMALYGSIPFMVMHNSDRTMGVLWMNAAETWVDIRSTNADKSTFRNIVDYVKGDNDLPQLETHWFSETGVIDVFLLLGKKHDPKAVFTAYKALTGSMPLPPLFALAHHQCRWNYNDETDVYEVDANFDKYDIPMDVLWLDIEHTDGKKYFTWDAVKFPDSIKMINTLAAKGRKMVTIIDPHIKRDDSYFVHKEATELKHYVKDRNSNDYDGWCWPGSSSWLDFTSPAVRKFWADTLQPEVYTGSTVDLFTWNDMNEPSVFNGPEITMHKDAIHHNNVEHRDLHNIYGMYQQRATAEGQIQRSGKRPFVLSRAFFVGTQRYGAIWTGDNTADWEHLKISIPMLLSLNIAGIVLSGADVGGFFGNPDPELMMRWYQAAAFQPFYRAHAHIDTKRREPWLVPEATRLIIRNAIRRRYALLPFWYTLFHESEQTGMPVMRPIWMEFPSEKQYFDVEDQYFIGSTLLVHPVTNSGATSVEVQFPGEDEVYYDVDTMEAILGNRKQFISLVRPSKIPVFQRGGSIIPRKQRVRRSSILMKNDPYTITVALDIHGKASGKLYIDDYESFDYKKGDYILRKFEFNNSQFTSSNLNPSSKFTSKSWIEKIVIGGIVNKPSKVMLSYSDTSLSLEAAYDNSKQLLVLRKPAINIAVDFKIEIIF